MKVKNFEVKIKRRKEERTDYLWGKQYGLLKVLYETDSVDGCRNVVCICDCGGIKIAPIGDLEKGCIISCGCRQYKGTLTHGLRQHPLYAIWTGMLRRCAYHALDIGNPHFRTYGGVKVCDEWIEGFKVFYDWAIINGYKKGLQIDRRDNDGNYTPGNCRFVIPAVNSQNRITTILDKDSVREIRKMYGERQCTQTYIAELYGIDQTTVSQVVNRKSWKNIK